MRLDAMVKNLMETKEQNGRQIMELQQQAGILKAGAGAMKEEDKKEFEKQVNNYLREVNKCIAMLSE